MADRARAKSSGFYRTIVKFSANFRAQPASRHSARILAAFPDAAAACRRRIENGLKANLKEANKARVILPNLPWPIQMRPGEDGSLWTEFDARRYPMYTLIKIAL